MKAPIIPMSGSWIPKTMMSVLLSISTPYRPGDVSHPSSSVSGALPDTSHCLNETPSEGPSNPGVEDTLEDRLHTYLESEVASGRLSWLIEETPQLDFLGISPDNGLDTHSDEPITDVQHDDHSVVEYIENLIKEDIFVEPPCKRRKESESVTHDVLDHRSGTDVKLDTFPVNLLDDGACKNFDSHSSSATDNASSPICSLLEADSQLEDHVVEDYLNSLLHADLSDKPTLEVLDESTLSSVLHPVPSGGSTEPCLVTQELHQRKDSETRIQNSEYVKAVRDMPAQAPKTLQNCPPPIQSTRPTERRTLILIHRRKVADAPSFKASNTVSPNTGSLSKNAAQSFKKEDIIVAQQLPNVTQAAEPTPSWSLLEQAQMTRETISAPGPQTESHQGSDQIKRKAKSQTHKGTFYETSAETTLAAVSQSAESGTGGSSLNEVMHKYSVSEVIAELLKSRDASVLYVRPPVSPDVRPLSEAGAKLLAAAEAVVEKSTLQLHPHSFSIPSIHRFESAPKRYGSSAWLLQMYLTYRRKHQSKYKGMFRDCSGDAEIQTALALHGFPNVDVSGLFQRAHTIVGCLGLTWERLCTIEDERIRQAATNNSDVAGNALAAELIHAAFLTKPFIKNIPAYIAEHNNHQAIHNDLIDDIIDARCSISSRQQNRGKNSISLTRQDWLAIKKVYYKNSKQPRHPLSFPQFLRDIDLIFQGAGANAYSKYRVIFSADVKSELQQLLDTYTTHPLPHAFAQGMRHGFVPSRYAKFYIRRASHKNAFAFGFNPQAMAGALVLMYKDLVLRSGLCLQDLEAEIKISMTAQEGYKRLAELDELLQSEQLLEDAMYPLTPASKPPLSRLQRYLLEGP